MFLPLQPARLPSVLQGVLHGALRASNVLLTAQRRYQVADYALQGVGSGTGASGSKAEVGTVLRGSALHHIQCHLMVLTAAMRLPPCRMSAMLDCDDRLAGRAM